MPRLCALASAVVAVAAIAGAGCGSARPHRTLRRAPAALELSSTFADAALIPTAYTCDGQDLSPPLSARGIPAATVELLIVMRDPDAPGGNFIHWALAGINPRLLASGGAGSGSLRAGQAPPGAVLGRNSFGSLGYRGPCPPPGARPHHYEITVSALGRPSGLSSGFSPPATAGLDVLAQGRLTGTYARR